MLINPVTDMKIKCKLNYTVDDGFNDPIIRNVNLHSDYGFNDINDLSITEPINNKLNFFQIDFIENIDFKSIRYDFTASSSPITRLYYSYDEHTYHEFEYFKFEIVNESGIQPDVLLVLKKFKNCVFKFMSSYTQVPDGYAVQIGQTYIFYDGVGNKITTDDNDIILFVAGSVGLYINHKLMIVFNENSNTLANITNAEAKLIRNFILSEFNNFKSDKISIKYAFDYYNQHTNTTEFLYSNRLIKSIRLMMYEFTSPTVMNLLEIQSEKNIDVEVTDLSLLNKNYFMPKYFEDNPFYPSVFSTFLEMLSGK